MYSIMKDLYKYVSTYQFHAYLIGQSFIITYLCLKYVTISHIHDMLKYFRYFLINYY